MTSTTIAQLKQELSRAEDCARLTIKNADGDKFNELDFICVSPTSEFVIKIHDAPELQQKISNLESDVEDLETVIEKVKDAIEGFDESKIKASDLIENLKSILL